MRNPYIIGNIVYGPNFYGRQEIVEEVLDDRLQCIYLIGNRRVGKTSILRYLEARSSDICLFLDMQGLGNDPVKIGQHLVRQIARSPIGQARDRFDSADDFCDVLQKLTDFTNDKGAKILLLIDEAEKIRFLEKDILQRLLSVLRNKGSLRTIIAASKGLSELNDRCRDWKTTPFLSEFSIKYISPLCVQEAKSLICQKNSSDDKVRVSAKLQSQIMTLTGNHPYLLQVLCDRLFDAKGRLRQIIPERDLVVDDQLARFFQDDYDMLSPTERVILQALVSESDTSESGLSRALKVEIDTLRQHLMGLEKLGYVIYQNENGYRISNYFLKTWLKMGRFDRTPEVISDEASLEVWVNAYRETKLRDPRISLITALPKELAAMQTMLENPRQYDVAIRDGNQRYFLGEIPGSNGKRHMVTLALVPDMGTNPSAVLTTHLLHHFPSVQDVIMVGIAGGVPHPTKPDDHVRLGDVVVSGRDGVVQYDYVKEEIGVIKHRHPPRPPRASLLSAVRLLESEELAGKRPWLQHIERANHLYNTARPPKNTDKLRDFAYPDAPSRITHPRDPKRIPDQPRVFVGPVASANNLLKDPRKRDALRDQFAVKAVEMEGSGVADATWIRDAGYLVVRGICDYCDPDKTDKWQEYAAVAAAAYTRGLLESMPAISATTDSRAGNQPIDMPPVVPANIIERPEQAQQPALALTQLRQKLVTYFNMSELRTLCVDLGVDYENIPDETKEEMARELVAYCERHGRIQGLVQLCCQSRPNVEW